MWGIRPDPRTVTNSIQPHAVANRSDIPALSVNQINPVNALMIQSPVSTWTRLTLDDCNIFSSKLSFTYFTLPLGVIALSVSHALAHAQLKTILVLSLQ